MYSKLGYANMLLLLVTCSAWDREVDECNFLKATRIINEYNHDYSSGIMPYTCTDWRWQNDDVNNRVLNTAAGVGVRWDNFFYSWAQNGCDCDKQWEGHYVANVWWGSGNFWCRSGFDNSHNFCYRTVQPCNLNEPPLGSYLSRCGCEKDNEKGESVNKCSAGIAVACPENWEGKQTLVHMHAYTDGANSGRPIDSWVYVKGCSPCPAYFVSNAGDAHCLPYCLVHSMPGGLSTEKGWRYERNSGTCRTCTRCDAYVDSIVSEPNPCPPRDGNYAYNSVGNCVLCRDNCANCNPQSTCFLGGTCVPDACSAGYMNVDNQYTAGLWQPFKVGYQRVAAVVGRRGVAGTPAYYRRCGENFASDLSTLNLRPIRDPVSIVQLLYTYDANEEIDRSDLTKDCKSDFFHACHHVGHI